MASSDTRYQMLDNIPHLVMRLSYQAPHWHIRRVNKAVERYGYSPDDFGPGKLTWNDIVHPDDRVVATTLADEYMSKGIDAFKLQYRILAKDGASIYVTESSRVNRLPDGSVGDIDSFILENLEASAAAPGGEELARHKALADILLTIQDAKDTPEKAIQYILDRVGALLDCSRALLFQDSPDHKTCKVVYEWLNHNITSIRDLDYAVTYATEMPEIYVALQNTGYLLVNAGEIPEKCREEFEAEGLVSSAIFAVYRYGDHYGFVCFDDCVIRRRWDDDTAEFLKIVANLLSNVVMAQESGQYFADYEDKIKGMAFRDHLTGLPNYYPFESDLADLILTAARQKQPGHVVVAVQESNPIHEIGIARAGELSKVMAERLAALARETVGETATLYRVAGGVFGLLVPPGPAGPVRAFAEKAAALGREPWPVGEGFRSALNVAVVPCGGELATPAAVVKRLDEAVVQNRNTMDAPLIVPES